MPRRTSAFTKPTKSVTRVYEGDDDTLTIVYRPDVFTPRIERLFQEEAKSDTPSQAMLTLLPRLVVSWDLLGDDDKPIPLTPEALEDVTREVLGEVLDIVITDMKPDPTPSAS